MTSGRRTSSRRPRCRTSPCRAVSRCASSAFLMQRLARDAADVEADPAPVLLLDDRDLLPQLRRADRRDVTTRTGTEHNDVEISHARQPIRRRDARLTARPRRVSCTARATGAAVLAPGSALRHDDRDDPLRAVRRARRTRTTRCRASRPPRRCRSSRRPASPASRRTGAARFRPPRHPVAPPAGSARTSAGTGALRRGPGADRLAVARGRVDRGRRHAGGDHGAAVGDRGVHDGHLQRGGRDVALADREVRGVTGRTSQPSAQFSGCDLLEVGGVLLVDDPRVAGAGPPAALVLGRLPQRPLPRAVGDAAGRLPGDVDAGAGAEPEPRGDLDERVTRRRRPRPSRPGRATRRTPACRTPCRTRSGWPWRS